MSRQPQGDGKTLISPKSASLANAPGAYPKAALQRFTDSLDTTSNPELKRFNDINKNRVQDFIKKPFDDIPKFHKASHPESTKPKREGFYEYDNKSRVHVSVDSSCAEFQRSLGNRSRFGDGDGSFWDKWVNTEKPTKGLGVDENGLPLKGQVEAPTTGFKRLYMNRSSSKKARPLARTIVEPYSVRREKRLQREREESSGNNKSETEIITSQGLDNYSVTSVKEDFSSPALQLPPKKSHRSPIKSLSPVKEDWTDVDVFEVDDKGDLLFNDAPVSLPSLTPLEMSSYFGSRARYEFLDIFRQLSRQRYNFKDNKFVTFDNVIEEVQTTKGSSGHKPKLKKSGSTRFSNLQRTDLLSRMARPPSSSSSSQFNVPRSPVKKLKNQFQRKMSTEEDPIEVTSEIESDLSNLHLTLPKDGPAKFARPLSPRHRFILGCINSKITPRPSLLIRKDLSTILNLEHQNMGDAGGVLLANALDGLPHLCSLNIADNNLTDSGLTAIIKKLPTCPYLYSLDVSENKIDADAADELSSYLLSPECALINIVMRKSDVDDNEIGSFVDAIGHSKKLINVDLSANLIGSNQRKLQEGLTMGGKVLGEMLCAESCKIQTLKLAWNMIRFDSGVELMQSLKKNLSLTYLDVSYNGLGDDGAQSFGDAIEFNSTLQTILLSNNNISSSGCFCIIEGIKRNQHLVSVDLTNNPIGERGGVSVMTSIIEIGDRVKIDIRGCSIARKEPNCWYDPENPTGEHHLDLSQQYARAVAIDMLKECAQSNGIFVIESIQYTPDPKHDTRGTQNMSLTLRRGENFEVNELKKMPPKLILDKYEKTCVQQQSSFFEEVDTACDSVIETVKCSTGKHFVQYQDMIKSLDLLPDIEIGALLTKGMTSDVLFQLGFGRYDWLLDQIYSTFDPLGINCIEVNHIKEYFFIHFPRYIDMWTEAVKSSYGDCYFEFEGQPYVPTNMGTLHISVQRCVEKIPNKTMSVSQKVMSLENINNILSSLKRTDNSYRMCEYALTNASLLYDEALVVYKFMLNEVGEKNIVLSRLLPMMPNYMDARQLVNKALGKDIQGRVKLRQVMGPSYRVHVGSPTGFYTLHLSKEPDRTCVRRLFDFSRRAKQQRIDNLQLGDTSQLGDGNGFRNAILDGHDIVISEEWFSNMPEKGKLEFDFVSFLNLANLDPMSDCRFKKLMGDVELIPELNLDEDDEDDDDDVARNKELHFTDLFANTSSEYAPFNSYMAEVDVVSDFISWCRDNKLNRNNIGFPKQLNPSNHSRSDISAGSDGSKTARSRAPSFSSLMSARLQVARSYSSLSKVGEEQEKTAQQLLEDKKLMIRRSNIWTVEYIIEAIGNGSISCYQLATLFTELGRADDMLHFNDILKKPYGTIKVEVLIGVFNQICDLANINIILQVFSPFERAALIFRLGILNVWSSVYPDGFYKIDLSKREEKLILRILITLSVAGSQSEFSDVDFRSDPSSKLASAEDQAIAGQFLKLWRSDKTLPEEGIMRFKFTSESGSVDAQRKLPDSLHSEMLSLLYAPPLLLNVPESKRFSSKRGLEISHSVKKTSIHAANLGVKFNFDIRSKRTAEPEQTGIESALS